MSTISGAVDLAGAERSAIISDCGTYRYELRRVWDFGKPRLYVGGLNPSTADAETDDQTVRKLVGFCSVLGLGGFVLWNLYALRSTHPSALWTRPHPVGVENDKHLERIFDEAAADRGARIVAAWGAHAKAARVLRVLDLLTDCKLMGRLECWGATAEGGPRHPSRIAYATPLVRWPLGL